VPPSKEEYNFTFPLEKNINGEVGQPLDVDRIVFGGLTASDHSFSSYFLGIIIEFLTLQTALYRKVETYIPRNETAWPRSRFLQFMYL
jgi:hypothetical protein